MTKRCCLDCSSTFQKILLYDVGTASCRVTAEPAEVGAAAAYDSESKRHVLAAGLSSLLGHANLVTLNTAGFRVRGAAQVPAQHCPLYWASGWSLLFGPL